MSYELNGRLVLHLIKKYLLGVILVSILVGVMSAYWGIRTNENTYVSSGELVQNDNNYSLIASYQQFVNSKRFTNLLDKKIQNSDWKNVSKKYNYTVAIESSGESTTPFFTLKVTSNNKAYAEFLTNNAITIFNSSIGKYLSGANITIVSNASNATSQGVKPKLTKWFGYGFIISFIILANCSVIKYLFIGKVKDDSFIEDVFNVKNLGTLKNTETEG